MGLESISGTSDMVLDLSVSSQVAGSPLPDRVDTEEAIEHNHDGGESTKVMFIEAWEPDTQPMIRQRQIPTTINDSSFESDCDQDHYINSSLAEHSPSNRQDINMLRTKDHDGSISFLQYSQDESDDKYTKTTYNSHHSKTRLRFRFRYVAITLGLVVLTYVALRSTSTSAQQKTWISEHSSQPNPAQWEERKDRVKAAFQHSWNAYRRDAWGKDEYHPISKRGSNMIHKGQGFTIVDSLDTILLMGLKEEFEEAKAWVRNDLDFNQDGEVNLFETTIRVLGGLLSAYDQSGHDKVFLTKAVDLADRLMGGFKTDSGIPYASVHLKDGRGVPGHEAGISTTSEVSTLQLEFKYLSFLTGNDKYWRAAEDVVLKMKDLETVDGLVPIYINPYTGKFHGSEIRLGSRGDSYYEYLIKQYLQTSKMESIYKEMYDHAINGVKKHLVGRTIPNQLLFVGEIATHALTNLSPKMDHLVCFLGGTMALSSTQGRSLNNETYTRSMFSPLEEEDFRMGEELTEACYEMYNQTETGLAPEIVYWVHKLEQTVGRSEPEYMPGSDFIINNRDGHNWLRPETVESLFYMWRFTGDEKYREWGWKIFLAIERYSKVESGGYSSIHDIRRKNDIQFSDKMETFFLAETLKYLYLLFGPNDVFPLDKIRTNGSNETSGCVAKQLSTNNFLLSAQLKSSQTLQPTSSQPTSASQQVESTTGDSLDATISQNSSRSDTIKSDFVEPLIAGPLPDPFNSQDYEGWNENDEYDQQRDSARSPERNNAKPALIVSQSWDKKETAQGDKGEEELSLFSKELSPIDSIDPIDSPRIVTFSSQLSGGSLRRLTLSPRKPKKKELISGLSDMKPMLSFSDKLAAEMGYTDEQKEQLLLGGRKPRKLGLEAGEENADATETHIVDGSDPESEDDWDDRDMIRSMTKQESEKAIESGPLPLDSDDDIPTLSKFKTKDTSIVLDESDSDLEDSPFSANFSGVCSPTPMATPSTDDIKDDLKEDEEDMEALSLGSDDEDEELLDQSKRGKETTVPGTTNSSRVLRSAVIKPPTTVTNAPISAYKPVRPAKSNKKPSLFSLDSLLKEKERKVKTGFVAVNIKQALDDELLDEYNDAEDDEVMFGPSMIPKGVLSEEQEDVLNEIIGEEYNQLIEDIAEFFVNWPQLLEVQPLEAELDDAEKADPIVQKVLKCTRTEVQRNLFLTSPYLIILSSSPWTMPRSLFRWLLHVMAADQNQLVTSSIYAILQRTISQKTSTLGVDDWDLARIFAMYGARSEYLEPDWKVEPVTGETKSERLLFSESKKFPRQNLKAIIKLINMTASLDPQFYNARGIRRLIILLLRMTTDPIIGDVKSLLGSTLASLLDAIPDGTWDTERHRLCDEIMQSLGTSLPFVLLILHQLPSLSTRITLLRRGIALSFLKLSPIPTGGNASNLEELHRALFVDKGFQINAETNYKELGLRVQVFGFCLDDEQMIASYGRKALEPLLRKLRLMHGKIVDIRAAFMERTLTKDMIQRLYMRIYYAGIHRQSASQTTLNFGSRPPGQDDGERHGGTGNGGNGPLTDIAGLRLVPELSSTSID
ncbi:mannosyl-oligosaccharide alpha-1,2-mannosidase [Haplosporangium sp. Z 767]|nr:mannosyl-oligosaccharide alpha-1,2-mannosidase [Haplosporangium sp. Z 767]